MKKNVLLIVCGVVAAVAVLVALLFVFSGEGKAPETQKPELSGTWVVAATYTNDQPVFTANQFMAFTAEQASMYKDGSETPYAQSSYTVNEANQLLLPDVSRQYKVDQKTANCVRLYEDTSTYMLLIRNGSNSCVQAPVTEDTLTGKWNVRMKGDGFNMGETLEFTGNSLQYTKAGADTPITAEFVLDGELLTASSIGLTMRVYAVSDSAVVFVEESGIVWELAK